MNNLIHCAEIFIKEQLSQDFSDGHDYFHTCRVVKHALNLCDQIPHADRNVVHIAAILHDVARPLESASAGKIDHAQAGAQIARDFLIKNLSPAEFTDRVCNCIAQHRFRSNLRPSSIEAEILFDADKLDSLGAIGIARSFFFAAQVGAKIHNSAQEALNSQAYSTEDTAYREFLVKLSKLPDRMLTEPGKIQAHSLKNFMNQFFEQLNKEFFQ